MVALANEARKDAGKGPIGDLNNAIYSPTFDTSAAFRDIIPQTYGPQPSATLASNQIWDITPGAPVTPDAVAGFATTTGYDMTTGFGSPAGQGFIDQVVAQ